MTNHFPLPDSCSGFLHCSGIESFGDFPPRQRLPPGKYLMDFCIAS